MTPFHDRLQFGPRLDIAAHSSVGATPLPRLENQDNFLLIDAAGSALYLHGQQATRSQLAHWPAGHVRIAVLDGMGGHGHGREAAEAVVDGLLAMPACTSLAQLSDRLDALHDRLQARFAADAPPDRRPGTTLTLLELPGHDAALLYHVGDSRLYQIHSAGVTPLTIDHVPATAFAMAGLLGEREWWQQVHGEHRSQISQAFILGNAFSHPAVLSDPLFALSPATLPPYLATLPDRRHIALDPGAVYVLATDGFWACADPAAWVRRWPALLYDSPEAGAGCEALFGEIARNPPPGLQVDNLTAIVVRVTGSGPDDTALPSCNATMPKRK